MNPSTGNDFNGGNTAGQGGANNVPVSGGAPVGGTSVNGGLSVGNQISMSGMPANNGMPVGAGMMPNSNEDIVLNPSTNNRKKSKLFVIIAIIVILIVVGIGVAVYFANENKIKREIKARWTDYYNLLVYGSSEKPEDSRNTIEDEPDRWFLRNLDDNLEKKGYDSYRQYYNDVKASYMSFYDLAKNRTIIKEGVYNDQIQAFLDYNLRDGIVDDLEKMYLEEGVNETESYLNNMFGDSANIIDVYLKNYFENYVGLMKVYDSNGCYDGFSSEESRICKITLNDEKIYDYYDAINYINDSLSYYYDNVFLIGFCTQMMGLNQKIGVVQ